MEKNNYKLIFDPFICLSDPSCLLMTVQIHLKTFFCYKFEHGVKFISSSEILNWFQYYHNQVIARRMHEIICAYLFQGNATLI